MNFYPKIKTGDSTLDIIHASFLDQTIQLSELQEEIKERLLVVWTLRIRHPSPKVAFNIYKRKTNKDRAQFFRDTKAANTIFGNLNETNKKAHKVVYENMLLDMVETFKKTKDNDNLVKVVKMLGETWEVASIDDVKMNPEKLTNPQIKLKISKQTEELIAKAMSNPVLDFNKLPIDDAEIVE